MKKLIQRFFEVVVIIEFVPLQIRVIKDTTVLRIQISRVFSAVSLALCGPLKMYFGCYNEGFSK